MHIREFTGADFEPVSKILGQTWHARHGRHAYWLGADELCHHLSQSDQGFVASSDEGEVVGVIILQSPEEAEHNKELRMHWLQQRTVIGAMASALGISARADAVFLDEEDALCRASAQQFGQAGVGYVTLLIVAQSQRGQGVGKALLQRGVAWLAEHGAVSVRLVTDTECGWGIYERFSMTRVLTGDSQADPERQMYIYEGPAADILAALEGADTSAPDVTILPSDEVHNVQVGELLNAHAARHGVEFVTYDYHINKEGRMVAGINAWAFGPDVHIDMLAVDESCRRQGLGGRLLSYVEEQARRDGCTTASVDTFSFQAPEFYPAHGYEVVFRYPLSDGTERIYFSKRL